MGDEKCYILIIVILMLVIIYGYFFNRKIVAENKKLKDVEKRFNTVMEAVPEIICFKDGNGRWIEINKSLKDLLNFKPEFIGKSDKELIEAFPDRKLEFELCYETDEIVWQNARLTTVEETFRDSNGENRIFDVNKVPLFNKYGGRKGLVVIGRDITDRKKLENNNKTIHELKEYNRIKTDFFANLSHELRTPLNLILSSLKLVEMMEEKLDCESRKKMNKYTNIIKQNSFRLIRLINNLIDTTKLEDGYLELNSCSRNIVSVVENITLSIKSYAEEKNIDIIFDTNTEEKYLEIDEEKMERIMLNLLSNAVKFTDIGGTIEVNLKDNTDFVEIAVSDTGIGIPFEKQKHIFTRFGQVNSSLSKKGEGSGIGLCLVKSFVELHEGNIKVDETYTAGTKFVIKLPYNKTKSKYKSKEIKTSKNNDDRIKTINIEFSDIYS